MEDHDRTYILCTHCGRLLHRSTVWRHQQIPLRDEAFTNDLDQPTNLPLHSPPPSPAAISLTSTEQALSELHYSELGAPDPQLDTPFPLQHEHHSDSPPNHDLHPLTTQASAASVPNDGDVDMGEVHPGDPDEHGLNPNTHPNVNPALVQPTYNEPTIEETDIDILNANAPPPLLPNAEEIFRLARFGISENDDDDDNEYAEELAELHLDLEDDPPDIEDFELPPAMDIDTDIELNAARTRTFFIEGLL